MKLARFDAVCKRLPGAELSIQWGESHVYKVGGKMFALGNHESGSDVPYYVFKSTPMSFELLLQQRIATRAPYLTRGRWVKVGDPNVLSDDDLADHLEQSYKIVAGSLTKATRESLGLI